MAGICTFLKASILSSSAVDLDNPAAVLKVKALMTEGFPLTDDILAALVDENATIEDVWTAIQ